VPLQLAPKKIDHGAAPSFQSLYIPALPSCHAQTRSHVAAIHRLQDTSSMEGLLEVHPRRSHSLDWRLNPRLVSQGAEEVMGNWGESAYGQDLVEQTAVLAALSFWDYAFVANVPASDAYKATGRCISVAAGRISYTYGFKGKPHKTPPNRHHLLCSRDGTLCSRFGNARTAIPHTHLPSSKKVCFNVIPPVGF